MFCRCGEAYVNEAAARTLLTTAEHLAAVGTQVDVRDYAA